MTKKYGGYTAAELREFIEHSENNGESIDAITGDDCTSATVIRDLLDALSAPAEATQAGRGPVANEQDEDIQPTPESERAAKLAAPTQHPARASEAGGVVAWMDANGRAVAMPWEKTSGAFSPHIADARIEECTIPLTIMVELSDEAVSVPRRVVELLQLCKRDGILKSATELQEVYRLIDAALQSHSEGDQP